MNSSSKLGVVIVLLVAFFGCSETTKMDPQGKVKREVISVSSKYAGHIIKIYVQEGDHVKQGDTLAIIDIPEALAKKTQATGAKNAASAQYEMALNGATSDQRKQLQAKFNASKEQYEFANKSLERMKPLLKDSLISPQSYDEVYAKYQGAKAQLDAVTAELNEVNKGVRHESIQMALGQLQRAEGAVAETEIVINESVIIAPQDMWVETVSLHVGELATPGYTIFNGYLPNSIYFRFTMPNSQMDKWALQQAVTVYDPIAKVSIAGKIVVIKSLTSYADITTVYPEFKPGEVTYELKVLANDPVSCNGMPTNARVELRAN